MLRRVILALLMACLAFPAAAMPMLHTPGKHDTMQMPAHHHTMPTAQHDTSHQHDGMSGQMHECIGCVARYDGVPMPSAPAVLAELPRCTVVLAQIAGSGPGPETPPPRC